MFRCSCGWKSQSHEKPLRYLNKKEAETRGLKEGQGVCPECGRVFRGCFKTKEVE